jgi:hypothetical protein
MKNNIYILIACLVAGGLIWYVLSLNAPVVNNGVVIQNIDGKAQPKPPAIPKFFVGTVTKVGDKSITIKTDNEEKTINVNEKTEILSQTKVSGGFKATKITIKDIKPALQVMVYYSSNLGLSYTAEKIRPIFQCF